MNRLITIQDEGRPVPYYTDGFSYFRVPKEDLVALQLLGAEKPLSNADIKRGLWDAWGLEMSSSHIRYHLKALLAQGKAAQIGRGLYLSAAAAEMFT